MIRRQPVLRTTLAAASVVALASLAACSTHSASPVSGSAPATSSDASSAPTPSSSASSSASTGSASASSSSSTATGTGVTVANHWTATHTGGGAIAAAVAGGKLWVSYALTGGAQGSMHGELVGYSLATGHPEVTAQVGAFPVAVAASSAGVWVANGVGDGSQPNSPLLNTVEQLTTSGKVVKTSRIAGPSALAASDSNAWVYFTSGQKAHVSPVSPTTSGPAPSDVALPGQPEGGQPGTSPLAYCDGKVFAVSAGQGPGPVTLTELGATAAQVARISVAAQVPSLACTSTGAPVLVLTGQSSVLVSKATGYKPVTLHASGDSSVAEGGGRLWLASASGGTVRITSIDDSGTATSSPVSAPASQAPLLAGDNSGLWVVAPSLSQGSATLRVEHLTASGGR
ncbi:MAG TPA: hypothetical protein VHO26_10835 [Propionibacteriaceae bacterium]|nr:hypothetical protein [Propionibacteriaceae bacterium]